MLEDRFIQLVQDNDGFEFYQAFQGDVDHVFGGKDNTYWYAVLKKGKVFERYIGKHNGGVWEDTYIKGAKSKTMPSGCTIKLIAEKAFFMQEEKWVKDRKGKLIEDSHPHYHYVYGFGDKGLDVSEQYGVTIAYSDIKDTSTGFHLRYVFIGNDVELP